MTRHHTQAMHAITLNTHGGPEQLIPAEIPDPTPLPDEVVVDLTAAALNRRDVWQRGATGNDGAVLGSDGAGRVSALGSDVTGIAVGDEVVINPSVGWGDAEDAPAEGWAILGIPRQGTYAERIAIPAADVRPRPQELTWHESAALPLPSWCRSPAPTAPRSPSPRPATTRSRARSSWAPPTASATPTSAGRRRWARSNWSWTAPARPS